MARTTIRTEDITASEVTTAKMAVDPTNASNLSSGSVPTAQLGNVDTTGLEDDIALIGFKVAANGSLAKYDLVDQTIDAFEDASGVDASASTNETRNASNYYSGTTGSAGNATGDGTQTTHGSYTVDTFLAAGDWIAPSTNTVSVLVVAGGGGGGGASTSGGGEGSFGAGGGAGGFRFNASYSALAQTYAVTVGAGGTAGASGAGSSTRGSDGQNSIFGTITSTGGGGGGSPNQTAGQPGGSGGGAGYNGQGGEGNEGAFTPVEGYDGGSFGSTNYGLGAAGGGGAGAVGTWPGSNHEGGVGGDGLENDYRTGSNVFYAGGGGGAYGGNAGQGGGGAGDTAGGGSQGGSGQANTGGGGGGGNRSAGEGGAGGSGIVVIRYTTNSFTTSAVANMTLVSNATTAVDGAPTKGDLVITYTDGAGTAVANTNIKAYISRDGSAYTSAVTLVSQGTSGGHTILTAHDVDLTGIASGTSMRYKIETLVQSASMDTRIQAVSLGWS